VLNGGANANTTSAGDTLRINFDINALTATTSPTGVASTINFATLATNGVIAGFEILDIATDQGATVNVTLATGIAQIAMADATANETLNITATAAQANAITSITGHAGDTHNLIISDAGTVSLAGDVTTSLDSIAWQDVAVSLTLNTTAQSVTQGATTAGTAAQAVTFGANTGDQTVTFRTTGTASATITAATLAGQAGGVNASDIVFASVAGATTTLNITGAGTTVIELQDADLTLAAANLDFVSVGGVTSAQTFNFGDGVVATNATDLFTLAGQTIAINAVEAGTTQVSYTFAADTTGAADTVLGITGFDATTIALGGDVLDLSGVGVDVISRTVTTTGTTVATVGAAANIVELVIGNTAAAQIVGALTQTGDAGAVEAAIIALGITTPNAATNFYVVLDNGTDTGVYRVVATPGADLLINAAADIASVTLVATLAGIADVGTLGSFNFA